MSYSTKHDMMPLDSGYWSECKRCGKCRWGRYVFEMRWYASTVNGAKKLDDYPDCVWHDQIYTNTAGERVSALF